MKRFDQSIGVFGAHEGFTDEDRIGSAFASAFGIFNVKNAAFADFNDIVRDLWYQ